MPLKRSTAVRRPTPRRRAGRPRCPSRERKRVAARLELAARARGSCRARRCRRARSEPSSFAIGWWPAAVRSMIASRRFARPTPCVHVAPSSSGPRWRDERRSSRAAPRGRPAGREVEDAGDAAHQATASTATVRRRPSASGTRSAELEQLVQPLVVGDDVARRVASPGSKTGSRPTASPISSASSRIADRLVAGDVDDAGGRRARARATTRGRRRRRRSGSCAGWPPSLSVTGRPSRTRSISAGDQPRPSGPGRRARRAAATVVPTRRARTRRRAAPPSIFVAA